MSSPLAMPQGHPKNIRTMQKHHLLMISTHIGMCSIFFGCSWGPASGELIWVDILILRRQRQKTAGNLGGSFSIIILARKNMNFGN
jgi:hypothetical protein